MQIEKKRVLLFIVFAIGLGWAVFLALPLFGIHYGQKASIIILAVGMFTPTLSNLLTRLITKEGFKELYLKPNFKQNIKKYIFLYFGPTLLLFASGALYFLIFPSSFDSNLTFLKATVGENGNISAFKMVIISVLQILLVGPIINIVPTLGEEFGWRAYLQPKLMKFFKPQKALLLTGFVWGFWHLPVIVMGHNYGTNYFGYPYLGILAMIVFCLILGIIEGYATLKLNSVIPAAMIHSTVNAGAGLPLLLIKGDYNTLLGPAITGFFGSLPFIVVAIIIFIKIDKQEI